MLLKKILPILLSILLVSFAAALSVQLEDQIVQDTQSIATVNEIQQQKRISEILESGEDVAMSGTSEVIIYDYADGSSSIEYFLRSNSAVYRLYFQNKEPKLVSGKNLKIEGKLLGNEIVSTKYTVSSSKSDDENVNLGIQQTVVLLVNSQDNPIEPITTEDARNMVFNELYDENGDGLADSINGYVKEVSYNKAWLEGVQNVDGDVFGWYTLPISQADLCTGVGQDAAIDTADGDVFFPDYKRLIIAFPSAGCSYVGAGSAGMITKSTNDGDILISIATINNAEFIEPIATHEFGHNFGNFHANAWECGTQVIGGTCQSMAALDPFDIMGIISWKGHFNGMHKEISGWLESSNIQQTNSDGIYFIEPIETSGNGLKLLRIPVSGGPNYFVEYRRPIGYDTINFDTHGMPEIYDGAMLHTDFFSNTGDTQLLDNSPQTISPHVNDLKDSVLKVGQTFEDSTNGIKITTLEVTDDYLKIRLGNPPPVTQVTPDTTPKNRYISFFPGDSQNEEQAIRVTILSSEIFPETESYEYWVGTLQPDNTAYLECNPFFQTLDPSVLIEVGDLEILPRSVYLVEATLDGIVFSDPVVISTISKPGEKHWADIVGVFDGTRWLPPNGIVNVDDVSAILQYLQQKPTAPPRSWLDIASQSGIPNRIINADDLQRLLLAFKGGSYPYSAPINCN